MITCVVFPCSLFEFISEDCKEVDYTYSNLRDGKFHYRTYTDHIGEEFISGNGVRCKIVKRLETDKAPSRCRYRAEYENGLVDDLMYATLKAGKFFCVSHKFRYSSFLIDKKFFNCRCKLCNNRFIYSVDDMLNHLEKKHNEVVG